MIAKGNLHAHGRKLATYLLASKDDERAELMELRGFAADNLRDAFLDVQIQAEATRATKPFFHAYVRLPAHEALTREQWHEIADRIEQRLGFEGQPRAIAVHHKQEGGVHIHVAWSRIDREQMKAIDPGLYKNKLKELCRELEKEYGLTEVRNDRDPADKAKAAARDEFEQARRLGTDLKAIRASIRDCWDSADSGKAFAAALDERGLILARGDQRDFVVVDHAGGEHAVSKRITGATAAVTRARLDDLDRAALPSVEEARAQQQARQHDQVQVAAPVPALMPAPTSEPPVQVAAPAEPEPPPAAPAIDDSVAAFRAHQEREQLEAVKPPPIAERGPEIDIAPALMVVNGAAKVAGAVLTKLTDMMDGLLDFFVGSSLTRKWTAAEIMTNSTARRDHMAQLRGREERDAALGRMGRDIAQGKHLNYLDVRALRRDDLENIRARGDAHLLDLIRQREQEEERKRRERGRER